MGVCHFHVDLDAFFASVEQLDHPEYRGRPVIVGAAPGRRGVVSTCSYEARKFGVHSAMPINQAARLCPEGVFLPVRMERYAAFSRRVMAIFRDSSPEVIQVSIDEAFLDMSGMERIAGGPEEQARALKGRVRSETGLTISVGVAPNRYLAKIASALRKPDGLVVVRAGEEGAFMDSVGIGKLWGVGEKTRERIERAGLRSIADIRSRPEAELAKVLGAGTAAYLYKAARGIDPGIWEGAAKSRSVSSETTFERDVSDPAVLREAMLSLAHEVMFRALDEGFSARTVCIKYRYQDFSTHSAQRSLGHRVESASELLEVALELLGKRWDGREPIRLVGVGMAGSPEGDDDGQAELFEGPHARQRRAEEAVLELRGKRKARITKASLLGKDRRPTGGEHVDLEKEE